MEPDRRNVVAGIILLSAGVVSLLSSIWVYRDPEGYPFFIGVPLGFVFVVLGASWIVKDMIKKKGV